MTKWTSKWADDGKGNRWGDNFGEEKGAGGEQGKKWVEIWDNHGRCDKWAHDL